MTPSAETAQISATRLRPVRGPSALSGGWRRCWRLVWRMARTDFVLRYKGSVLGYVWSLLSPLLLFGVIYFAFTQIVQVGKGVPHYPAMLLFNLMMFQFFTEATSRSVISIVAEEHLVRRMEFPRAAVPLSIVLASTPLAAPRSCSTFLARVRTTIRAPASAASWSQVLSVDCLAPS